MPGSVAHVHRWFPGPTVGMLLELLEENYRLLLCLAPDLRRLSGAHRAPGRGTDLYLEVIEQAPYTTLLRLTYRFPPQPAGRGEMELLCLDPDARLRVSHDARQVEVIALRQTVLPLLVGEERLATLKSKWDANWFLSKWLDFCVREEHRVFLSNEEKPTRPAGALSSEPAV